MALMSPCGDLNTVADGRAHNADSRHDSVDIRRFQKRCEGKNQDREIVLTCFFMVNRGDAGDCWNFKQKQSQYREYIGTIWATST